MLYFSARECLAKRAACTASQDDAGPAATPGRVPFSCEERVRRRWYKGDRARRREPVSVAPPGDPLACAWWRSEPLRSLTDCDAGCRQSRIEGQLEPKDQFLL